jgi:RNA-binding signal recognition particle 68
MEEPISSPMEEEPAAEAPRLSLRIHQTIQEKQAANGLRHSDYLQYRHYCTRRLRRVRTGKSVKFTYGKGKVFVNKAIAPEMVKR